MSIGENIKKARGSMKQSELAEKLKVDVSTISRWENNKNVPNSNTLAQIANVLNTSPEFLLGTNPDNELLQSTPSNTSKSIQDSDIDIITTGGIAKDMLIIDDKRSGRVYRLPNNEEGRKLFLTALISGTENITNSLISNSINGDNNSGNKLGLINN